MDDMFARGLELMLVGMGVVFAFLLLLVWLVGLMSRLVARLAPDATPPVAANTAPAAPAAGAAAIDARTLAVIREAVRRHRER
ncbi:MAG: OadG family transporter subunit [Gammaproteobacteria bacterium]